MTRVHGAHLRAVVALAGWLASRLMYGLEVSRLAVFRFPPGVRIQWVRRTPTRWGICQWLFTQGQAYCLSAPHEDNRRIVVTQFPPLCRN